MARELPSTLYDGPAHACFEFDDVDGVKQFLRRNRLESAWLDTPHGPDWRCRVCDARCGVKVRDTNNAWEERYGKDPFSNF